MSQKNQNKVDERIFCDLCQTKEIFYPIHRMNRRICLCVECAREIANLYVYDFECRWIDPDYAKKYEESKNGGES